MGEGWISISLLSSVAYAPCHQRISRLMIEWTVYRGLMRFLKKGWMTMAKKQKKEGFQKAKNAVKVHQFINSQFMMLSKKELSDMDDQIDKLMEQAEKDLEKAPLLINDRYTKDDVVQTVEDGDSSS